MRLVLDSSAAIMASRASGAMERLAKYELFAPPLLWSEVYSRLSQASWRREISQVQLGELLDRFERMPVLRRTPEGLYTTALALATELGWAKTYDAEFLALAQIEGGKVLTVDQRFRRDADRTGLVIGPSEI